MVAVSGGSDSLSLLILLDAYLRATGGEILAVTVDHGLRPQAADEAAMVARLCAQRGIRHRTIRWEGEKPATGVSAASREARYRLLAEAAVEAGTSVVMTGHTMNDQAETIAMRRERGDGRGLAGMAPATLYDGKVWIVRPLLGWRRSDLRAFLAEAGVSWVDDPSNEMAQYERVAARRALAGPEEDEIVAALIEQGRLAAEDRVATGEHAGEIIARYASLVSPGLVRLDPAFAQVNDRPGARLALRILLAAVGGREHLPDAARARKLYERLEGAAFRGTLGGTVVDLRKSGTAYLHREMRAGWTGAMPAAAGGVWDGRYRISGGGLPENAVVEALGGTLAAARVRDRNGAPQALMRAAMAAEPLVHVRHAESGGEGSGQGGLPERLRRLPAPWIRFLPSFDLAPARALAELLDGDRIPEPPLRSHIAA
ncbi:tRNA lysidine(34) synthetase TilS [Aquibium sp. LZ166]|uniref:tRNA(Ile)-lysidine synthase n=1 Tax=Aquibium pacificus TaxID=3153579 RepID=A0ABV3SHL7_9HYPH